MDIFLAQAWGLYLTIVGVGLLLNAKQYKKTVESFAKNSELVLIAGAFTLVLGILHVLSYNVWTGGWPVIITVLGWVTLLKGAVFMLFPEHTSAMVKKRANDSLLTVGSVVVIVLGVYLLQIGF